jgi:protein-L-isoaspartate(D-aspartate) O-methyltransferase
VHGATLLDAAHTGGVSEPDAGGPDGRADDDDGGRTLAERRERMVARVAEEVRDPRVLAAMRAVPRHEFVPPEMRRYAYADGALPIGRDQTISQPLIVGMMTEALALDGSERVLEVGTGSGYQAAVLARQPREVVTVEVVQELRERAATTLARLAVANVRLLAGGEQPGAPALAPFDAILVAAAAPAVPPALLAQLADGGRLILPVGAREAQDLWLLTRRGDDAVRRGLGGVRFVPLVGRGGYETAEGERSNGGRRPAR